jgi:SNF2 family DNA or RNA helicase
MFKIDLKDIIELSSNQDTYNAGVTLFKQGAVVKATLSESSNTFFLDCHINAGDKNQRAVAYLYPTGGVKGFNCTCTMGIWRGACSHVVAALRFLAEMDATDITRRWSGQIFDKLADDFKYLSIAEVEKEFQTDSEQYSMFPIIQFSREQVFLSFEIGLIGQRLYKTKNITELAERFRHNEVHEYGKKATIHHKRHLFDEKSRKLIDFFLSETNYLNGITRSTYDYGYLSNYTKNLGLFGNALDSFFDLYNGETVSVYGGGECTFTDDRPEFGIHVSQSNESTGLEVRISNNPLTLFTGSEYDYLKSETKFTRVSKLYSVTYKRIKNAVNERSDSTFLLDGVQATDFMSYIYPILRKCRMLSESGEQNDALFDCAVPELKAKLYFDTEDGIITCKPSFEYGSDKLNPLEDNPGKHRDLADEYRIIRTIENMGFIANPEKNVYELNDDDAIYEFYTTGIERLKQLCELFATNSFDRKVVPKDKEITYGIRLKGNLLEVDLSDIDYSAEELAAMYASISENKRYHKLTDGRFVGLENKSLEELTALVASLDITKRRKKDDKILTLPKYRALFLDKLSGEGIKKDKSFRNLIDEFKNFKESDNKPPEELVDILRPYQSIGYSWLKLLDKHGFGGVLADDMGLGKTLQVISVILEYVNTTPNHLPSIVVCPTSLLFNWHNEIKRFAPSLSVTVLSGTKEQRKLTLDLTQETGTDIYITTYDMLKRDIDSYDGVKFKYIIADEAQYIKNAATQNAQAVKSLDGEVRFALTGTPMENALSELWSIFDFVLPEYLYTSKKFSRDYETPIIKNENKSKAAELKRMISPFVLRRLKGDVLKELPDKIETTLYAEMTEEQRKLYTAYLLQAKGEFEALSGAGGFAKNQIAILALLTRLRQICCHPKLIDDNYANGSGKLETALDTIRIARDGGHRLLVFSQFTSMLSIITRAAEDEEFSYFYLDGATPSHERMRMVERFNGGERDMFFISLKAGGTGLNLTGADVVIQYDPWWNPAVMDQANDRAHRFGQKKTVTVYNLVAAGTIEERILDLHSRKRDLIDSVVGEGNSAIGRMTEEDVRELLG